MNKEIEKGNFSEIFDPFVLLILTVIGPWLFLMYCFQLCWNKINGPQPKIFGRGKRDVGI